MNRSILVLVLLVVSILGYNKTVLAQPANGARLTVANGGYVQFAFNSIDKYENGVSLTNYTTLGISIADSATAPALVSWTLDFRSLQANITGDGGNNLALSTLELTASNNVGLAPGLTVYSAATALTMADQTLVTSTVVPTASTTHQVNISYDCGTTVANNLIEEAPDYYVVDIQFTLIPGF